MSKSQWLYQWNYKPSLTMALEVIPVRPPDSEIRFRILIVAVGCHYWVIVRPVLRRVGLFGPARTQTQQGPDTSVNQSLGKGEH